MGSVTLGNEMRDTTGLLAKATLNKANAFSATLAFQRVVTRGPGVQRFDLTASGSSPAKIDASNGQLVAIVLPAGRG